MGALHRAAACADGRGEDALRRELIDKQAHAQHVGHGVDAADLVEVDVFRLYTVHLGLSLGQKIKDRDGVGAYLVRHRRRGKKAAQLADRGVGVTMAQLFALLVAGDVDLDVKAEHVAGRAHAAVKIQRFHKLLFLSFASSSTRVKYGASASRIASHFSCAAAV